MSSTLWFDFTENPTLPGNRFCGSLRWSLMASFTLSYIGIGSNQFSEGCLLLLNKDVWDPKVGAVFPVWNYTSLFLFIWYVKIYHPINGYYHAKYPHSMKSWLHKMLLPGRTLYWIHAELLLSLMEVSICRNGAFGSDVKTSCLGELDDAGDW